MTDVVRDSYDSFAELYTSVNRGAIEQNAHDREWLAAFAELATLADGPVADLGCGPGFVTNHLAELGLAAHGYDLSPALVATARDMFPELTFQVADFTALDIDASSLAGIVSRYSLIHDLPARHAATFVDELKAAGFDDITVGMRGPSEGERPLSHATILARRPNPAGTAGAPC